MGWGGRGVNAVVIVVFIYGLYVFFCSDVRSSGVPGIAYGFAFLPGFLFFWGEGFCHA